MRIQPLTPVSAIIFADADTTIPIPSGPPGGQPIALGYEFIVVDNLGTANAHNIALSGPIGGTTSGTAISTNFANAILRWGGTTWTQK
jgi:hypothetical protein